MYFHRSWYLAAPKRLPGDGRCILMEVGPWQVIGRSILPSVMLNLKETQRSHRQRSLIRVQLELTLMIIVG